MKNHFYIFPFVLFVLINFISCQNEKVVQPVDNEPNINITFKEIFEQDPAIDSFYTQSVASVDLNNDNFPELYLTNSWESSPNHFYKNFEGKLKRANHSLNFTNTAFSNGCCFADIDNNGALDLFVANAKGHFNTVFFGEGNFNYNEQIVDSNSHSWSYNPSLADIDNDGILEVYISNFEQTQNKLYKFQNNSFHSIESTIITENASSTFFSTWSDLNGDGYQDLIVCNDSVNFIYENEGGNSFRKVLNDFSLDTITTYGCSVADFNNDGLMDIFVANWVDKNWIYKNLGDFNFEKLEIPPFDSDYNNSEGSCWGDYDNDGFVDLLITNDGVNVLYKNIKGESFEKWHFGALTDSIGNSNGVVWTDIDLDGDLDIIIANGGNQRNQIFENSGNDNNWVKIKLEGTTSNRSAIGARVIVYSGDLVQHQEVQSQSGGGCGSQKPLLLHFGIGQKNEIDSVQIKWPSSSMTTQMKINHNSINTFIE